MFTKKSLLISIVLFFFVSNVSFAVMCARLKHVSGGEDHTLALMDDNTLWACGGNYYYTLGLGSSVIHAYSLDQVLGEDGEGFLQNVATYDAGWFHSLAADANGTLWAWGYDDYGQLGNGSDPNNWDVPQKVHGVNDVNYLSDTVGIVYVSAGRSGHHSLVVDSNGYVYAFGLDSSGQCGDGSSGGQEDTPVLVLDDDPETDDYLGDIAMIIAVDAGVDHSIALDDEGYVWEWGENNGYSYPQKVPGVGGEGVLDNIIGISTCYHSVTVDSNGFVYEWRYGNPYKVTDGEMDTASDYLENIVEISAGYGSYGYSMARTSDGYVLVWGVGGSPEYVEDGEMETQSGLLEDIISIGAGYYDHKLAICENGYGWAWGTSNSYGQFGVGDNGSHPKPTQMLCAETSSSIYLTKTFEIQGIETNCARPFIGMGLEDNYLVYDVNYGNPITDSNDPNYYGSVYDVNIVDHLPLEVDFNSVTGGGVYDGNTHTVTWTIGELAPGDSNSFAITTKVNNYARPGGEISNFVEMTADMYYSYATDTVPVCNWGREIIYVDQDANGYKNGTSWYNAYTDLQDAFTGAKNIGADITAIWVAAGTYKPVWDVNEDNYKDYSFELLENVGVFGHFGGVGPNETSTSERDFADANNETILEGQIGDNYYDAVEYIVTANDIDANAVLDGFTIKGSYSGAGVFLDDSNVAIVNCKLKNNRNYGIDVTNYSYPDIHNCVFLDNSSQGVRVYNRCWPEISASIFDGNDTTGQGLNQSHYSVVVVENCLFKDHTSYGLVGSDGALTVTNCSIKNSDYTGIDIYNCDLTIDHSVIANNGDNGVYASSGSNLTIKNSVVRYSGEDGIELHDNLVTTIKNNWIHNNGTEHSTYYGGAGICFNNQNQSFVPLVRNNTIYDNWTYGIESSENGADPNVINCIIYGKDGNDFYRENGTFDTVNYCNLWNSHDGTGNITGDPGFMNIGIDSDDLHLDVNSQCKDRGDPNGDYGDETDIDGESRIKYGRVDIGADEYYYSLADIDKDGKVNLVDYAIIAGAWKTEPNDDNYDEDCDLEDNNAIDYNDVALFCEDWMWQAAWPEKEILLATDFEGGIPVGWTVVDGYDDGETWTTDNLGERDSPYWTGDFCIVDSAWAGPVDMNEMLITLAVDCSGTMEVTLKFSHYFRYYELYKSEKGDVDLSINDGPWQTVLQYTDDSPENVTEDISALAADQPNVRVRWHYYDANYEYYWGIDNVKIIGNFRIPPMQMMAMGGGGMGFGGLESMSLALFSLEKSPTSSAANTDDLMLSNAESMAARPERLTTKSQKFYDITPARTISGKQKLLELERILEEISTKIILKQFDEMWYRGEFKKVMTEDEYLEFRKAIEVSLQSWPFARIR